MSEVDLSAYFSRIGYSGPSTPTLAVLRAIHALHPASIPFENIDVLLKTPIRLDAASLHAKMIQKQRGGYCFEQNTYFQKILEATGFSVRSIAARVLWHAPPGVVPPRNHMALVVHMNDGEYLADVGYGRLTLNAPLRIEPHVEQHTVNAVYRLLPVGPEYQVQIKLVGEWVSLYQLSMQEQVPADWEVANYYTSTNPNSQFTTNLLVARTVGDRRYGLLNNMLRIHRIDGSADLRVLETPAELEQVLRHDFNIALPEHCGSLLSHIASKR
jgi:N-hydroxyarylamine O-acetyltransferase